MLDMQGKLIAAGLSGALVFGSAATFPSLAFAEGEPGSAETPTEQPAEQLTDGWHKDESGQTTWWESGVQVKSRWVTAEKKGVQRRFWIDADGHLARGRFVDPKNKLDAKAGHMAYVNKNGTARTGTFKFRNRLMHADSNGKLVQAKGFKKVKLGSEKKVQLRYFSPVPREKHVTGMRVGFFKAKGKRYYAAEKNAAVFSDGLKKINGKKYYADKSGAISKISDIRWRMVKEAAGQKSRTRYLVMVDTIKCRCGVFKGSKGHWENIKYWPCTVGKWRTPTVKGTFRTLSRGYSFGSGFTCYWYTRFHHGYMLHSQTYHQGTHRILYGGIGNHYSHGCVRLHIQDAHWIYKTLPLGTTVHTY